MGCASVFVIVGLLFPFLHLLAGTWEGGEMALFPVFVGLPAFVVSHILAIIAICSEHPLTRRGGKRALLIMWGSIALMVIAGFIADAFFRHPGP